MNRPGAGASAERTLRLARFVVLAMAFGVVVFGVVAFVITLGGAQIGSDGFSQPFLLGLGVLGVALVGAYPVVRRTMIAGFRSKTGGEPSTSELGALFMKLTIVGAAMSEAFCLFGLISYLITSNEIALFAAALGLVVLLRFLPSEARLSRFQEAVAGRGPV